MFKGFLGLPEKCEACGLDYDFADAGDGPAVFVMLLAGFIVALGVAGIAPLVVVVGLTALELFIAALQAYVFAILTCIYLNDALHLH